jgi:hypothetical protein
MPIGKIICMKFNIPNPCSENRKLMSPQEKGRFCALCNKWLMDFTQIQPQEIEKILEEDKASKFVEDL